MKLGFGCKPTLTKLIIWLIVLVAIIILFSRCTTINTDDVGIENYGKADWHGRDDGPPPSSINPPLLWLPRSHHTPELEFVRSVEKQVKRLKANGYIVPNFPRYIYYSNDGINWRRGDICGAVIYWKEAK